jgi:hypothetical protein
MTETAIDPQEIVALLAPEFGKLGLSTKRAVDADEVRKAVELTAKAKKSVRVYSAYGFVPNRYRSRCEIQYVDGQLSEDGWKFRTGWTGAQRSNGAGSLWVVDGKGAK